MLDGDFHAHWKLGNLLELSRVEIDIQVPNTCFQCSNLTPGCYYLIRRSMCCTYV